MSIYKKFAISLGSYIFLGWFICQPLNDVFRYKPYYSMPEVEHEINAEELDAFLNIWSKMIQSSYGKQLRVNSLKTEKSYSKGFTDWLELQHWNVERFFYDEERIRDLLEFVEVKKQLDDNHNIAKSTHINLLHINKDLEKRLEASQFNDYEVELIEANAYQITEILAGRAVLGKGK
jgi:hypothetical protein